MNEVYCLVYFSVNKNWCTAAHINNNDIDQYSLKSTMLRPPDYIFWGLLATKFHLGPTQVKCQL